MRLIICLSGKPFKVIGTTLPHRVQFSPNFGERKGEKRITTLILHYTGMSDAEKACGWLCDEQSEVSCHYLVDEEGKIVQMVDEQNRAWHAGLSTWQDESDINSVSIGIEIQNPGHSDGYPPFPDLQMQGVIGLCQDIVKRYSIDARLVLAHSDVAPGRKVDPGEKFDWALLHKNGVGHWVAPQPIKGGSFLQLGDSGDAVMALQGMLKLYGYGLDVNGQFDQRTKIVTEAFQRHFRPARVDGVADQSTVATLHKLMRGQLSTSPEQV
jgi:N-acetylmuramoyl-L-alanine amidase